MKSKQRAAKTSTSTKSRRGKKSMDDVHGSEDVFGSSFNTLRNDLDSDSSKSKTSSYANFDSFASTSYGYKQSKKLMKSRSDKKWAGVCGGLAKYFGISSTVARLLFVIAFFMTSGTSLLIYIGLSLAMPKEPVELMDDFEF
jgi:phage shock protein PspC (stress-responsive transcriptional regulator)